MLNGTWKAGEAWLGGQALDPGQLAAIVITLRDGEYWIGNDRGRYVIDATIIPNAIDIVGTSGPNEGRTIFAIFAVDGDRLSICYDLGGETRPAVFRSDEGTMMFLVRYRREGD